MSIREDMMILLEKRRTRDTAILPPWERPGPKRRKRATAPVHTRPGFEAGSPRRSRRRAKTDTQVINLGENQLSPLAKRILKHMQRTGAAYGIDSLSDSSKAPPKKVTKAIKELQAQGKVSQDKKSKSWYAESIRAAGKSA